MCSTVGAGDRVPATVRSMVDAPVLGVDGCRGGWVGIVLAPGDAVRGVVGADIGALVAAATDVAGPPLVVGVDMPLHLSPAGWRPCDAAMRAHLGARRSTVFPVPPAPALALDDYAAACAVSRELTGKAFSKQLWMLRPKIRELDAWWSATGGAVDVREVHPETSFSLMVGRPLATSKRTPEGLAARRSALADQGIDVPDHLGSFGGRVGADDVLDAAAVAWTARRIAAGAARSFPDPPVTVAGPGVARVQAVWA
jgi:predicted RNase H-like nuclease